MRPRRRLATAVLLALAGLAAVGCRDARNAAGGRERGAEAAVAAQTRLQAAVEPVLAAGLVAAGASRLPERGGRSWPLHDVGPGASVRCRVVTVAGSGKPERLAAGLAAPLASVGARVLACEPLGRGAWRLDVGVPGCPTHTLALVPPELATAVRWTAPANLTTWTDLTAGRGPLVALIIDDWGQSLGAPQRTVLDLPVPLTLAVLPGLPRSREIAALATPLVLPADPADRAVAGTDAAAATRAAAGPVPVSLAPTSTGGGRREIFMHLPMQPVDYPATDPGPGSLLLGMDRAAVGQIVERDLTAVPGARGVNNHMGSAATADEPLMDALMAELHARGLRFVDSLTTPRSVAFRAARRAGVPALRNRMFLDVDHQDEAAISASLASLVQHARATGRAVGIAHPHAATAAVLARELPRYAAAGVRFVTVSEFLELEASAGWTVTARAGAREVAGAR